MPIRAVTTPRTTGRSWCSVITTAESKRAKIVRKIASVTYRTLRWGDKHLPFGARSVVGVVFMVCGVFWFLPAVGMWMFPLGLAFVALDIPWTRPKIHNWMLSLKARAEQ